ncbi:hypothetical protein J6590_021405 [Homalodisca vitripennis]|nr:hypothetical protein J6590_021405 [Homalodisca vitripennis]
MDTPAHLGAQYHLDLFAFLSLFISYSKASQIDHMDYIESNVDQKSLPGSGNFSPRIMIIPQGSRSLPQDVSGLLIP